MPVKTAQELVNHLHDAQRNGVDLSQVKLHLGIENEIGFWCDKYNFVEDFNIGQEQEEDS